MRFSVTQLRLGILVLNVGLTVLLAAQAAMAVFTQPETSRPPQFPGAGTLKFGLGDGGPTRGSELGKASSPVRIWTRSGLPLDICWTKAGKRLTSISLTGEGRLVYRGIIGEAANHKAP